MKTKKPTSRSFKTTEICLDSKMKLKKKKTLKPNFNSHWATHRAYNKARALTRVLPSKAHPESSTKPSKSTTTRELRSQTLMLSPSPSRSPSLEPLRSIHPCNLTTDWTPTASEKDSASKPPDIKLCMYGFFLSF